MLTLLCRHLARRRWEYALTASGILFVLSSVPIRQPLQIPYLDKAEHGVAYLLLGLAYFNAGSAAGRHSGWLVILGTWAAVVAFGISDEVHQAFVPGRSADVADVLADAVGGALGVLAALRMRAGFVRRLEE
jgi:VanZ family protein